MVETIREKMAGDIETLFEKLADFGVAERRPGLLLLAPLGVWAVQGLLQEEGSDAPGFVGGPDADPAELLEYWGSLDVDGSRLGEGVDAWLAAHSPESAVQALADASRADIRFRPLFMLVLEQLGPDATAAISKLQGDAALGPYAAIWLADHDTGETVTVSDEDLFRVLADQLIAVLMNSGPEDVVEMVEDIGPLSEQAALVEMLGRMVDPDVDEVLQALASSHPDLAVARAARKALLKER